MTDDPSDAPWGTLEGGFDAIHSAARMRDVDEVRRQLELGVDVNVTNESLPNGDGGNTALWFAAQGDRPHGIEVAKVLVEAGADVNIQCEHGWTALHMAVFWGHVDVVKYLIAHGANAELRDVRNMSPAMIAETASASDEVTELQRQLAIECRDAMRQ